MQDENEQAIKNEMRLFALESLVCHLWALTFKSLPAGAFEIARAQWLDGARQMTFPGVGAAQSDLYSAELECALERLVRMVQANLKTPRKRRKT
jgi:hypothetical protein